MLSRLSGSIFVQWFFFFVGRTCVVVVIAVVYCWFVFYFRINQNSHRAFAVGDGGVLVPLLVNVPPLTKDPLSLKYQHVDHRQPKQVEILGRSKGFFFLFVFSLYVSVSVIFFRFFFLCTWEYIYFFLVCKSYQRRKK